MTCTVNPAVGFEATLADDLIVPAASPKRVVVVGGGPAGLEAARIAALHGHRVTLFEASPGLGGALAAARLAPRSALLGDIVDWLAGAIERAGVEVVLERRMTAGDVVGEHPDAVIVATGSRPRLDGVQPIRPFEPARGAGLPHVRSSLALLRDGAPPGTRTALVLDAVGHFEAISAAEFLVGEGIAVTYVTSLPAFGGPIVQATNRDKTALEFLDEGDFKLLVRRHLVEIRPGACVVRPLHGRREREVPADVVVLVTPNEPNRELYEELVADGRAGVIVAGDAASPRDLTAAIAEGNRAARQVPSA